MYLLVEAEWGLPREQDVGVVGYGEFRPLTPTYPAAVITNNPPAPEATKAIRPGTVSDLAMLGEGADLSLWRSFLTELLVDLVSEVLRCVFRQAFDDAN
jgi:hypothetical protein